MAAIANIINVPRWWSQRLCNVLMEPKDTAAISKRHPTRQAMLNAMILAISLLKTFEFRAVMGGLTESGASLYRCRAILEYTDFHGSANLRTHRGAKRKVRVSAILSYHTAFKIPRSNSDPTTRDKTPTPRAPALRRQNLPAAIFLLSEQQLR